MKVKTLKSIFLNAKATFKLKYYGSYKVVIRGILFSERYSSLFFEISLLNVDAIVHTYNTSSLETEEKGLRVQVNVDYKDSQKIKMNSPAHWPCLTSIENTLYSLDLLMPNPLFLHLSYNGKNCVTV